MPVCSIDGCEKRAHAQGYCASHYGLFWRHGDATARRYVPRGAVREYLRQHLEMTDHASEDCEFWPHTRNAYGRPVINIEGKVHQVCRLICEHHFGPPPAPKMDAAHSCGNGHLGCVNPNHLRWATKTENEADKEIHGTRVRGERNYNAFLTEDIIRQIRSCGLPDREVTAKFGVNKKYVWAIRSRKVWKHVA